MENLLKTSINSLQEKNPNFSFYKAINELLADFSERSRDIVNMRYGISYGTPKTLEEIGKKYQITRERVRQIIQEVLRRMQAQKTHPLFAEISRKIIFTLNEKSGIMGEKELILSLGKNGENEKAAVSFFLDCFKNPALLEIRGEMKKSYAVSGFNVGAWRKVKACSKEILEKEKNPLESGCLFKKVSQKLNSEISQETLADYLEISEEIRKNNFGKWGMASWQEINPKGTREKAYLVLKEANKPLHFQEIAGLIDLHKLNKKKTHPQTVHNELIKDKRFVLVGRGIYALSQWGYKKGTVKDVLEEIIRGYSRPVRREEILKKVLEIRQVKKSTVMINLNNFFSRINKDEYVMKK
jgi:DNA-directed RNA polymerase delta subunit